MKSLASAVSADVKLRPCSVTLARPSVINVLAHCSWVWASTQLLAKDPSTPHWTRVLEAEIKSSSVQLVKKVVSGQRM